MKKLYIGLILLLGLSLVLPIHNNVNAATELPSHTIKVMSYNIAHGEGYDNNIVSLERIANVIRDSGADIVGLQEVDRFYSDRSSYDDQIKVLADLLKDDGFEYYGYGANLDLKPHKDFDVRQYGTAILSKYPIKDIENIHLSSQGKEQRGVLMATLDINGVDTQVFNTHLALILEERIVQVEEIVELMQDFSGPQFLIGDLNTLAEFVDFEYLIDQVNLTDTFENIDGGLTYPAIDPFKRIDFILTTPQITFDNQKIIQTLASDHLPIIIDATIDEGSMIELTVVEEGSPETLLEGAVFEVKDKSGNIVASDVTTDQTGQAKIKGIKAGEYQLTEVLAPLGYVLNTTPVSISIGKGEIIKATVGNTLAKGAVEITFVDQDDDNIRLTDGVFELQDANGQALQAEIKPNTDGQIIIDDLQPGDYQIVQMTAPLNYELNMSPLQFTIDQGQSEMLSITHTNEMLKSAAELILIDSETNLPIIAGQFELQDIDGNTLREGLTVSPSGKLVMDKLKPGNYQIIATESPVGYEEITSPITFEIKDDFDDDLVIMIGLNPLPDGSDDNKEPQIPELDFKKLKDEVNNIIKAELDMQDYTSESWGAFIKALEKAQGLIEHLDSTQEDIDQTLSQLKATKDNLVLIDEKDDTNDKSEDKDKDKGKDEDKDKTPVDKKDDDKTNKTDKSPGEKLPKTATNFFNIIMIGMVITLGAGVMLIVAHRRKVTN